ncbi:MAG: hypothetical protein JO130_16690 [Solirubrobacterales bacterium]|nr:hypothetical protein [Solirubrobacterales bacterium]
MSDVKLEWASAEVEDARLTVTLKGEVPKGWKQSFERTVQLLGDGEWGAVTLKKQTVQVSDVSQGSEDKLRHHLESIVAQANADQEPRERDAGADGDGDGEEPEGPDAEMTGRFRAFAEADDAKQAEQDAQGA